MEGAGRGLNGAESTVPVALVTASVVSFEPLTSVSSVAFHT